MRARSSASSQSRKRASPVSCASASRCSGLTWRNRAKNFSAGGRRLICRKSMSWIRRVVSPSEAFLTASTRRRRPGTKRSCPARMSGPDGTSRIPVASTTMAPGLPLAKRAYQSTTSSVTMPSSVARHGTMAGTQVRELSVRGPTATVEKSLEAAASSALGQFTTGSACLIRSGGCHISGPL